MDLEVLKNNIIAVKQNIDNAISRSPYHQSVLLVGASKTMSQETIDLVDEHQLLTMLGENRAQELRDKYRPNQSFQWHYIGTIQANKIKYLHDRACLIESVDSLNIASDLQEYCCNKSCEFDILLQVNMGQEESKFGFLPQQIDGAIAAVSTMDKLHIKGIMAVMPKLEDDKLIGLYQELNKLYSGLQSKYTFLQYLSAGMTNDYELAIEYGGANIVRVGRAIFGEREYVIKE